jgi:long-chain-alcohol oxidase
VELEPWDQSLLPYSSEHSDLDGNGYGVRYVGQPLSPWMLAYGPWAGARAFVGPKPLSPHVDDSCSPSRPGIRSGDSRGWGTPVVDYRVASVDYDHVRAGVWGAAQIAEAAGAKRIWPQPTRRLEHRPTQFTFYTTHQLGTARTGGSPATSATDPERDMGCAKPDRRRWVVLPDSDRDWCNPFNLDGGDRVHELEAARSGARIVG